MGEEGGAIYQGQRFSSKFEMVHLGQAVDLDEE